MDAPNDDATDTARRIEALDAFVRRVKTRVFAATAPFRAGNQRFRTLTLAAQRNGAIHGPDQGHGLGGRLGGDANVAADADGGHRRSEGGHDEGHLTTLCRRALLRMTGRADLRFGFIVGG